MGLGGLAAFVAGCQPLSSDKGIVKSLPEAPGSLGNAPQDLIPDTESYAPTRTLPMPAAPIHAGFHLPADPNQPIPRSAWTHEGPNLRTILPMNGVQLITFHHSGDPRPFTGDTPAETAGHLEAVRRYHRSRNFQDIGYHFAIDRAGYVWQLRSLRYQGQHVRYHNPHNLGVVVLGNFDLQQPTEAQKVRARTFGAVLRRMYALPLSRVYTHQELVSTECPGRAFQPYMVYLRRSRLI
jgi:hypothetical protein